MEQPKLKEVIPDLAIVVYEKKLCTPSQPVTAFDEALSKLADQMFTTAAVSQGVGLAAPQVGKFIRMAVIATYEPVEAQHLVIVNPVIIDCKGEAVEWERCLSLPGRGARARVRRCKTVTVDYQDLQGEKQTIKADGWFARILQHEIDHLDGTFYIDRVSSLQKSIVIKKFKNCLEGLE